METSPKEIRRVGTESVQITWGDGHVSSYPNRTLRAHCQCAQCVDEITRHVNIKEEDISPGIFPQKINLVGRYALQFDWSDGHGHGIYPFERLREICPCNTCHDPRLPSDAPTL